MISLSFRSSLALRVLDEILVEQALADELLGDRRGAATAAAETVEAGRDDRQRIEARVLPERLVLDRGLASMRIAGMSSNVTTSR